MGNSTTRRPRRSTASATATGMAPPPAMIASGPASTPAAAGIAMLLFGIVGAPAAHLGQHDRSAALGAQECDDLCDFDVAGEFGLDPVDARGEIALALEQQRIGLLHGADALPADAAPAHADDVDTDQPADGVQHEPERNNVVAQRRVARDHGALANACEL